jgi:hypothetical protein
MPISEQDIELFAARVRLHFAPESRDVAYDYALRIAKIAGPRVKCLRPETTLGEIYGWLQEAFDPTASPGSLDQVEIIMALEEEFGYEIPDPIPEKGIATTFQDVVEQRVHKHRVA